VSIKSIVADITKFGMSVVVELIPA
jgi:hypothetical protein